VIGNKEYLGNYADRNQLPHAATPTKTMPTESSSYFYRYRNAVLCIPCFSRTLNFDTKKNPKLPLSPLSNKRRRQIGVSDRRRTVRAYNSLFRSNFSLLLFLIWVVVALFGFCRQFCFVICKECELCLEQIVDDPYAFMLIMIACLDFTVGNLSVAMLDMLNLFAYRNTKKKERM
jgi:hypothetical protein